MRPPATELSPRSAPMRYSPAHGVRVRQPPKKARQLAVLFRPDNKLPLVGQNTIRQNTDRSTLVRLNHDALELLEVGNLAEHPHPADRSVQYVINKPTRCDSRCSWHNTYRYQNRGATSILTASLFQCTPDAALISIRLDALMVFGQSGASLDVTNVSGDILISTVLTDHHSSHLFHRIPVPVSLRRS